MRREYEEKKFENKIKKGLPLHAQGILQKNRISNRSFGITPACAGNTQPDTV